MSINSTPEPITHHGPLLGKWVIFFALSFTLLISAGCVLPLDPATGSIVTTQLQSQPVIAVAPLAGGPGTQVAVSGSGWQPVETITLKIESVDQSQEEIIFAFSSSSEGTFATSFPFPVGSQWQNAGTVNVVAIARETNLRVAMPFQLGGSASGSSASGPTPTWTSVSSPSSSISTSVAQAATAVATNTPMTLQPGGQTNIAQVISPGLNVRSGPSSDYPVVVDVLQGTTLTVLGQSVNGSWLQVRLANGTEGWVARFYTDYQQGVNVVAAPPLLVRPSSTPTATPISIGAGPSTEWRGEYYANRDLAGLPAYVRNDSDLNFNWGNGSPEYLPGDSFSVRWTRTVELSGDEYRFHVRMDDGVRFYVDDNLIIDRWRDNSVKEYSADIWLNAGFHTLRVEYYEHTGTAEIAVWWESTPDSNDNQTDNDDTEFPDWKGEYYTNRGLDGDPRFRRNDREINFNWGSGSPSSRLPDNNFSVRWRRSINFEPGRYRFYAQADDGVRVYIDGNRIINEWHDNSDEDVYVADRDLSGWHEIQVNYYERNGGARIRVWWDRIDIAATATPTPTPNLTETPVAPGDTATPLPTFTLSPTWVVQASANVQPGSGSLGTALTVSGGAFPPNVTVNVNLGALAGVQAAGVTGPATYASTTTDSAGSYSVSFVMPGNWASGAAIPSGQILILVATEDYSTQASTIFNYVAEAATATPTGTLEATPEPTLTNTAVPDATATPVPQPFVNLGPTSGEKGTSVNITGGGFPSNIQVNLYLGLFDGAVDPNSNPVNYRSAVTDDNGNYSMNLVMPENAPDGRPLPAGKVLFVVANNDFSLRTQALFDFVVPAPPAAAAEPTATPTEVPTEVPPTAVPPTLIPTSTATEVPPTLVPTSTPTELPPEPAATAEPVEEPTEEPTATPAEATGEDSAPAEPTAVASE